MTERETQSKKLDRRIVRTRTAIMNAFDRLLTSEEVGKITVSAIAREADIDRKTFYLHYKSIDDLINQKAEANLEQILVALKNQGEDATFNERIHIALQEVNRILSTQTAVYARIVSRLSIDEILDYIEHAAEPALQHSGYKLQFVNDAEKRMQLQFYFAGALSLYATWLRANDDKPIEEISAVIERSVR